MPRPGHGAGVEGREDAHLAAPRDHPSHIQRAGLLLDLRQVMRLDLFGRAEQFLERVCSHRRVGGGFTQFDDATYCFALILVAVSGGGKQRDSEDGNLLPRLHSGFDI